MTNAEAPRRKPWWRPMLRWWRLLAAVLGTAAAIAAGVAGFANNVLSMRDLYTKLFEKPKTALSFSVQNVSYKVISVLVSNDGMKPGSIQNFATVFFLIDRKAVGSGGLAMSRHNLRFADSKESSPILINPHESRLINYVLDEKHNVVSVTAAEIKHMKCYIGISAVDADGKPIDVDPGVPVPCGQVEDWLYSYKEN